MNPGASRRILGEKCLEPKTAKTMKFGSYEEYRDFIIGSRRRKDRRDGVSGDDAFDPGWGVKENVRV